LKIYGLDPKQRASNTSYLLRIDRLMTHCGNISR
jgi:hypothetical protein